MKPSDKPEFATDGAALVADPGSSKRHAGFNVDEAVPAHWLNWLFRTASEWVEYLSNLHAESEFLNKTYAWTGEHSFVLPLHLVGTEALYSPPRLRTIMIPLHGGSYPPGHEWQVLNNGLEVRTDFSGYRLSFSLPTGAKLTRARVGSTRGSSGGTRAMGMYLDHIVHSKLVIGPTRTVLGSEVASLEDRFAYLTVETDTDFVFDRASHAYELLLEGSSSAADVADTFHWLEVTFWDPGPRNF